MKKLLLMFCLGVVLALPAFAQRPDREKMTPEEVAKRQTQMMKDSLQLDEKQIAKVDAINLEYAKKMMELREKDVPQAERMQEFQVMQTNKDYEIKKCLNKEQAKRYQKIQEAMRARRQDRRKDKEN
jgi:periplasmic protein CpxP/Spy